MLKRHIAEPYKERVVSIDAIRGHFKDVKDKSGLSAQANFTALPLKGETFDYVNFSLAFHETSRVSARREEYDRVQTLAEISRVLKKGGRAVINMIYSKDIADKKEFKNSLSFRFQYFAKIFRHGNCRQKLLLSPCYFGKEERRCKKFA